MCLNVAVNFAAKLRQTRSKIAAKSRRSKLAANSRQKFFSLGKILPQIYHEILPQIFRDAAKSRQNFAKNVRLICRVEEKNFAAQKKNFATSLPQFRGKQPIPL
jgi:hypothetical protein